MVTPPTSLVPSTVFPLVPRAVYLGATSLLFVCMYMIQPCSSLVHFVNVIATHLVSERIRARRRLLSASALCNSIVPTSTTAYVALFVTVLLSTQLKPTQSVRMAATAYPGPWPSNGTNGFPHSGVSGYPASSTMRPTTNDPCTCQTAHALSLAFCPRICVFLIV